MDTHCDSPGNWRVEMVNKTPCCGGSETVSGDRVTVLPTSAVVQLMTTESVSMDCVPGEKLPPQIADEVVGWPTDGHGVPIARGALTCLVNEPVSVASPHEPRWVPGGTACTVTGQVCEATALAVVLGAMT